jgi:hypothetical protein
MVAKANNNEKELLSQYTKVILKLYRRFFNNEEETSNLFRYLLWGYYDGMEYSIAKNLAEFFSGDQSSDSEQTYQTFETKRICLYSNHVSEADMDAFLGDVTRQPLLVISELKIDESNYPSSTERDDVSLDQLESFLLDSIKRSLVIKKTKDNALQYRLFRSMGYSEFVIVFRTDHYQHVADVITYLRGLTYPFKVEPPNPSPLLRSTYSTAGASIGMIESLPSYPVEAAVRISFKKMFDMQEMHQRLADALGIDSKKIHCSLVFGKYDMDVRFSEIPLNLLVSLFYDTKNIPPKALLDHQGEMYKFFIGHTNTRWLLDINTGSEFKQHVFGESGKVVINVPKMGIEPPSIKEAYEQICQTYYQIARDDASEPLLIHELDEIMQIFSRQVEENYKNILAQNEDNDYEDKEDESIKHYDSVKLGLDLISKLLQSRIQAFRFFSEMPSFTTQFIRPTTKIFVMYMTVIEEFEKKINEARAQQRSYDNQPQKINLFATLDYQDKVVSHDLFPETKERIIPIVLNFNAFYDFPYNFLLLIHEISHYIQSPDRMKRNKFLTEMFCRYLAKTVLFRIITGEDHLAITNFEFVDKSVLEELEKLLYHFFFRQLWTNGKFIGRGGSIRRFPASLLDEFDANYSFVDSNVANAYNILVADRIFQDNPADPKQLVVDLRSVLTQIWGKIYAGEDLTTISGLWYWLLDQAVGRNPAEILIGKADHRRLMKNWNNLIATVSARKELLILGSTRFFEKKWFKLIHRAIELIKNDPEPNTRLLSHLALHRMNENTKENCNAIAQAILQMMNGSEFRQELEDTLEKYKQLFIEARADFLMCKFLELRWEHYEWLIEIYKKRTQHGVTQEGLQELDLRKWILCNTNLYKKNCEHLNWIPEAEIGGMPLNIISDYLNDFADDIYLTEEIDIGRSLYFLRQYYKGFSPKDYENQHDFPEEIKLIEHIWTLGMRLFRKGNV